MKSYIFITTEGYTYQSESESIEPDIENCQVIGFAQGKDEEQALERLIAENPNILETTFDEVICLELKYLDYFKYRACFHLDDYKANVN